MRPSGSAADVRRLIGRTLVVGTDRRNRAPHVARPRASVRKCRQRMRMEDGVHDGRKISWDLDELYVMKRVAESARGAEWRLTRAACRGDATINDAISRPGRAARMQRPDTGTETGRSGCTCSRPPTA